VKDGTAGPPAGSQRTGSSAVIGTPIRLPVREEWDVVMARKSARELALREGFPEGRMGALATAVTEVTRNIVVHAGAGEVLIAVVEERGRRGVLVVARDDHPGMADVEQAMKDGYSSAPTRSLGLGLPSARRLMDEFSIESELGKGTTVTMKKWARDAG
jgi:serine/threonine-protein kinase RsbT